MFKSILFMAVILISSLSWAKSNAKGSKHRSYLANGVAHPSYLGEGIAVGLLYTGGIAVSAVHTSLAGNPRPSVTTGVLHFSYDQVAAGVSQAVSNSNGTSTTGDPAFGLAFEIKGFGIGLSEDDISLLYGVYDDLRIGANYDQNLKEISLGVAMDFSKISLSLDGTFYSNDSTSADNSSIGGGVGYFGDSIFIGVNTYSNNVVSGGTTTTSSFQTIFLGYSTNSFVIRGVYKPNSDSTSTVNDDFYQVAASLIF